MKTKQTLLAASILSFSLLTATGAHATLESRLDGLAVYDTDRDITWLANANLAATNTFGLTYGLDLGPNGGVTNYGPSIIATDGTMTWGGALKWIDAMNAVSYLGFSDWRLPTTTMPDWSCQYQANYNTYSYGSGCTGSEMGHLYYNELGGVAGSSIITTHNANYSLFNNVQYTAYWSRTEYAADPLGAMSFGADGGQSANYKNLYFKVLAVRSGQVTAVPVPAAAWLFTTGLLGLAGVARRRR